MIILSLFDGISCGRVALERAGIPVKKYLASEIDKYAMQIAKKNYPDTIHIGSVCDITYVGGAIYNAYTDVTYTTDIDMIIGGSPCQNLSRAGDKKGFQGDKSMLFGEFVRLLREIKPKYFLFENVASMSKENLHTILQEFQKIFPKIYVHMIDSLDFVPQKKKAILFYKFSLGKTKVKK